MPRRISPPPRKEFSDPFLSLSSYHRFSTRKYVLGMFPIDPCANLLNPDITISQFRGNLRERHPFDIPKIRHLSFQSFKLTHPGLDFFPRLLLFLQDRAICFNLIADLLHPSQTYIKGDTRFPFPVACLVPKPILRLQIVNPDMQD